MAGDAFWYAFLWSLTNGCSLPSVTLPTTSLVNILVYQAEALIANSCSELCTQILPLWISSPRTCDDLTSDDELISNRLDHTITFHCLPEPGYTNQVITINCNDDAATVYTWTASVLSGWGVGLAGDCTYTRANETRTYNPSCSVLWFTSSDCQETVIMQRGWWWVCRWWPCACGNNELDSSEDCEEVNGAIAWAEGIPSELRSDSTCDLDTCRYSGWYGWWRWWRWRRWWWWRWWSRRWNCYWFTRTWWL